MKIFAKLTLSLILFFSFATGAFPHQIGVWEADNISSNFNLTLKNANNKLLKIKRNELAAIKPATIPVLIFYKYTNFDDNNYNTIVQYTKNGGKIILITPIAQAEDKTFAKLSKLAGVNVEKIKTTTEKTYINWVEKTIFDNKLDKNSRIAQIVLYPETTHLAVFGDIEKHETAISKNNNGSVICWNATINGEKRFNEKSLNYILDEFLPKESSKQSIMHMTTNHDEEIEKLKNNRNFVEKYQDNIINYSSDMSVAQQNIELSKTNELLASYYFKNNNYKFYTKYLKKAKTNAYMGTKGTNSLAPAENRGIWFDRGTIVTIKNQSEMGQYFEKLKKSGINTVYFETVNAGYTIYPSKIGTQNPLTKGKDPLMWAVAEAHARKIKIHAWMWVFAVGNDRHNRLIKQADNYAGPVLEKNQRWALLGENGNMRPKNQPEFWIDPSNKEGVNYLLKLAEEITKNYNVDGIQLDYIRYPFQRSDNQMGFNHNATEQFAVKTGEKLCNNYQTNFMWNKWKEENINNFVKKVSIATKRIKPSAKISASIFAKPQPERLASIQQNWENWIINSSIDSLTPMSYSTTIDALNNNLKPLKSQSANCLIYPGIALKHVDETAMLKQILTIRENGFAGVSFFAIEQLDSDKAEFLNYGIFSTPSFDPSYNSLRSAIFLLEDYKKMLLTIKQTTNDLTSSQKIALENMLSSTDIVLSCANNSQPQKALDTLSKLETQNNEFFTSFSNYNDLRKQTANSYINRASNLIKISKRK